MHLTLPLPRALKDRIPLSAKLRVLYHVHNALARLPGSERVGLRLAPKNGMWLVEERGRERSIGVTAFGRWVRFDRGIAFQLERLAKQYGVGKHYTIERGDAVLDVGANVGEFTLYAYGRGARVVAVEADEKVAKILRYNTRDARGVDVIAQPIWEKDGTVTFYSSPADAESSIIAPVEYDAKIEREALALDTVSSRAGLERIKVLKCDAEGAEPEVLRGASATLARTEWVAFDCGPERGGVATYDTCRAMLEERGFQVVSAPPAPRRRVILVARNTALVSSA